MRINDMLVFLIGGHHTTALTLACACIELAKDSRVLHKLQLEIDAIYGDKDTLLNRNQLSQLTYLDKVINETLRIQPVASATREAERDMTYKQYRIPKGSLLIFSFLSLFRTGIRVSKTTILIVFSS